MSKYNIKFEKVQVEDVKNIAWKYVSMVKQDGAGVIDVVKMSVKPRCHIKRISKDMYLRGSYNKQGDFISDGEVIQMRLKNNPMRNRRSLRKIFIDLRRLIAHNFSGGDNELFVTLTYAEQTNDSKQIYNDFKQFWQRLQRRWDGLDHISIVEPHASGMFHIHVLLRCSVTPVPWHNMLCDDVGIYLHDVWRLGFVKVEHLNNVDNLGAYFIAYFTNMEIFEGEEDKYPGDIEERNGKKFIKGMRLDYYPDYMQIYRYSRGLDKPDRGMYDVATMERKYQSVTKMHNDDGAEIYLVKEQYKE